MMTALQAAKGHQHHRHVDEGDHVPNATLSRHDLHIAKSRFRHALLLYLPFGSIILDCILKKCFYERSLPETDRVSKTTKTTASSLEDRCCCLRFNQPRPSFFDVTRASE